VQLRLLGPPSIRLQGWQPLAPSNHAALLCYLAYRATWVSREEAALLIYPDISSDAARTRFRQLLRRARKLPGGGAIEAQGEQLRLQLKTDVQAFVEAVGESDWAQAVERYSGHLLGGFSLRNAPGFEHWLELERASLASAWHGVALKRAGELNTVGDYTRAASLLKEVYADDSLAEDVLQTYLENSYLAGRRNEALKAYEAFRQELKRELDLEPLEATQQLANTIRQAQPLEQVSVPKQDIRVPMGVLRPLHIIGRDNELKQLKTATTRVTLLSGEPGVGKTRLLETVGTARWLKCREGLEELPYFPVLEHIRKQSVLPDLGPYHEDLARLIPELAPDLSPAPLDPQTAKPRLLEALARVLEAETTPLIFDDLQWADKGTLELLVFIVSRGKLTLFGTYRSSEVSDALARTLASLRSGGWLTPIELEPLSKQNVRALLASLTGADEGPQLFSKWLFDKSGGNPFFALQTLKVLFETGTLQVEDGQWSSSLDEVTQDYSELAVPPGVSDLIKRRVARLSETARRVLQIASVMREGFSPTVLGKIAGLSEWAAAEALAEVEAAELVREDSFIHDLLRQAVYADSPLARRHFIHAKVASALETHADPLVVAEHYFQGGDSVKALELWWEVIDAYQSRGLGHDLLDLTERVAKLEPNLQKRTEAQIHLTEMYRLLGRYEAAEQVAESMLADNSDAGIQAWALGVLANTYLNKGDLSRAAATVLLGLDKVKQTQNKDLEKELLFFQATVAQAQGAFNLSISLVEPLVEEARQEKPSLELSVLLNKLGSDYSCVGRYEEALSCYQEALEVAQQFESERQHLLCLGNQLSVLSYMGYYEEGLVQAEKALKLSQRQHDASFALRYRLAKAYLALGDIQAALAHAKVLVKICTVPRFLCGAWLCLAEAARNLNHTREVHKALEEALTLAEQTDVPQTRYLTFITATSCGTKVQIDRARALVGVPNLAKVPYYLRSDLKQALKLVS